MEYGKMNTWIGNESYILAAWRAKKVNITYEFIPSHALRSVYCVCGNQQQQQLENPSILKFNLYYVLHDGKC